MNEGIIGIFDSGLGGLSVMKAIRKVLPQENLVYIGDCRHAPYGEQTPEFITDRVLKISDFLISQKAKAIVIACNTATAAAIDTLRSRISLPVIGVEPALKPAIKETASDTVGVMATSRTIESARYAKLIRTFNPDNKIKVISVKCIGLMECVEKGDWDSETTRSLVEKYTLPFKEAGADFVVLGCTHYPFLKKQIGQQLGPHVRLYDPSPAVAREVRNRLTKNNALRSSGEGKESFFISGLTENNKAVLNLLWGEACQVTDLNI